MGCFQESREFIINSITRAISDDLEPEIEQTCKYILDANKVFVYGVGRSGLVAQSFAIRMVQLGLDVHFVGESTTPIVTNRDVMIIVSNTGSTMSAVQTANISRREGLPVIAVTSRKYSKLAHAANLTILLKIETGTDMQKKHAPLGTLFEDTAVILFELITVCLMRRLNKDEHDMRSRHAIWV
ncbi:MAG TPA: SIS domain-containing protein [Euryarchaeota archaeon]|nr:SIS domain-containing protein [Euryarchaeota archaeon]